MRKEATTFLKIIDFTQLVNWSSYSLLGKELIYTQKYPFVRIGDFLTRNKEAVKIRDEVFYKRATIRINGNGISLRDNVPGKAIGTKNQFRIHSGQFLLSKIDARNGAFGVVPEELEGGIITGNFWTFDVDYSKINPHYLTFLTGTKEFQKLSQSASVGTTNRNYLQEIQFLNFRIPLPSIKEQQSIIDLYDSKIKQARIFDQETIKLQLSIEQSLFEKLGVQIIKRIGRSQLLQFVDFTNTFRWDTLFLLGKIPSLNAKYPMVYLKEIITNFNRDEKGKSLRIDSSKYPEQKFNYIGMENIEKETGNLLEMPKVLGNEIKSQTIRVPQNFFIYGKLRPYLNKYWINNINFDNIICSSEFFVFDIDNKINKQFFKHLLSSQIIQIQISDKTSGARMPRINEDIFFSLQFPLPPKEVQDEIEISLNNLTKQVKSLKIQALKLKMQAEQEFENQIFK